MACPLCDDSGWKPVDRDGVRAVTRCDCWRQTRVSRLVAEARLPRRYEHCSLASFETYGNETLERAVAAARRMVERFPASERGLFLIGPPGVGKTHLAVATVRAIVERTQAVVLYFDTRELLRALRETFDAAAPTSESAVMRQVLRSEVLILDDLGAQKSTEWSDETLNLIVNHRYSHRAATIFTSNYDLRSDASDPDSLLGRIGYRMHSRLHEMCDFLQLDGADYRELEAGGDVEDLRMLWQKRRQQQATRTRTLPTRGNPARAHLRPSRDDADGQLTWTGGRAGT